MKNKSQVFIIVAVIIACLGLGIYLVMNRPAPEPTPVEAPEPDLGMAAPNKVKVYQVDYEENQTTLRAVEEDVERGDDPIEIALRSLIEKGDSEGLANPIPQGTRLLGFAVEGDLATVNLSREFKDNFAGGSQDEALIIGAILRTLAQFPEVRYVTLEVEGQPLDSLGHLDLSGPQDVSWVGTQFGGGN